MAVGRRHQSESIEVALDLEEGGLMNRFVAVVVVVVSHIQRIGCQPEKLL